MPVRKPLFRNALVFCTVVMLTVCCGTGGSAGWEDLREEANELYNGQQYQEALYKYEKALSKAQGHHECREKHGTTRGCC